MKAVRAAVRKKILKKKTEIGRVHPRLVLNIDQVWKMRFRPSKQLWKPVEAAGSKGDAASSKPTWKKLRAHILEQNELALEDTHGEVPDEPLLTSASSTLSLDDEDEDGITVDGRTKKLKPAVKVQEIAGSRIPRTVTTSSWLDGTLGPSS